MDSRGLRSSRREERQRSRSRSRSRSKESKDRRGRDRPHPLGRDQPSEFQDGHATLMSNASGHSSFMNSTLKGHQDRLTSAQQTYARLSERRHKLEALRKGLDIEEPSEMNSLYSEPTDFGEAKSMISANSYTRGKP